MAEDDSIEGSVRLLEAEVGLPPGFLEELHREDDWSFIIKAHALLEAAVSRLLSRALGHDALLEVFSFLELSDKRSGKVAFVKCLDLLSKEERRFIGALSELRNKLVHDVSNARFDLVAHVAGMNKDQFKNFYQAFAPYPDDVLEVAGHSVPAVDAFRAAPKIAIWWYMMLVVAVIYQAKETAAIKRILQGFASIYGSTPEAKAQRPSS